MSGILPCLCSCFCQADNRCEELPRFQVCLEVEQPEFRRSAEACATHLGVMVTSMSTWVHDQQVASAELTVLTITPPPRERQRRRPADPSHVQTDGFVFSTIHLRNQVTNAAGLAVTS
jgi:hypothetical protein